MIGQLEQMLTPGLHLAHVGVVEGMGSGLQESCIPFIMDIRHNIYGLTLLLKTIVIKSNLL